LLSKFQIRFLKKKERKKERKRKRRKISHRGRGIELDIFPPVGFDSGGGGGGVFAWRSMIGGR